ncbi:GPW/gp25 family protein [Ectopseudomonas mendocina]|uniref:GPW/gp25 family protein n=1 Tax=Ectopseudomonas mendocina TaxID=300 RepID=UPI000206DF46|nr:GPW/gp25 family protein [Pseudomonas mendocina]AEB58216.1 phage P2 baseplate assembly gpW-like protein [Pseudomonas mendocina NK-01]
MNRQTGSSISDLDHLKQSVADILGTRIGTRLARREYGSNVPDLIDEPFHGSTTLRLYAATAMALMRWEPRIRITRVQLQRGNESSTGVLDLEATRVDTNEAINLQVPLALGASA